MKYGIIKVKRAFLYEENGVDVVDEVFFGWSVMWEDEGEWIEVWTHYGYRGWMERNLIEEKSREWMEEREKAGNTYVVTRGFADVMRGARVQSRMLETLGRGCFVEKMEETENGYCRVKLANGISGFVPEVALRKRLDSDRFLWGKSEERFFVEQGIPEGWSEEKFRRKVVECPFFFRHKILRIICFFFDHIAVYVFFYRKDKLRPFYFCGHPGQIRKLLPQIRCGLAAVHTFFPASMMNPGRVKAV